tara:strand:+ start:11355 stop:11531 length:177 start_codon:yes stop_codon:yes gene_type:complete
MLEAIISKLNIELNENQYNNSSISKKLKKKLKNNEIIGYIRSKLNNHLNILNLNKYRS